METMQAIQEIAKTTANVEVRVCRRIEIGTVLQQGDVYVHCVSDAHSYGAQRGSRQVAVGTGIGARHVAEGDDVDVYEGVALPDGCKVPEWATQADLLGPVVVARKGWVLTHPEHAHHALPAGIYQVTYQLDYSTQRRVRD